MKTKLVNRFYCDFCRKTYQRRATMARHESSCVKNPNRVCDLCAEVGVEPPLLTDLIGAARHDVDTLNRLADHPDADPADNLFASPDAVREVAGNCPACMLAGIAQAKVDVRFEFDFKEENDRFWAIHFGPEDSHG